MGDVICYSDLDQYGRETDDPYVALEQDVVHLLLEAYGSNCDALTRSIGLDDALSGADDPTLQHRIETKLTDDDRITSAQVTFTNIDDITTNIELLLQGNDTELGIVVSVDSAGIVTRATS